MFDLFGSLVMIALFGWLIVRAIIAARRDRYIQTLKYIHIYQGKHGPFRNQALNGFSRRCQEKLIAAAARARARAASSTIPSAGYSPSPIPSSSPRSPQPPE